MQKDGDPGRQPGKRLASGKQDKPPKEPKPKKPGRLTRQQKFLIALAAVLAVGVVGVAAWQSLFVRPDLSAEKEPPVTVDPDTGETEEVEEIDWGEGTRPRSEGERKSEDYYTVLILGRDTGGGGNTDTMLLASYDVTNQKATVMSIPRDTMVNVPWDIKKINSVYNYYGGGDRGIQYLYKEISQLVGFEPDFQVIVEWEALGEIVDAMGGVWFDVPRNMDYEDPYQDLSIHLKKGYQLLDGEQAMGVVRFRDGANGYKDGDIGRIGTQQAFLKAVLEQLLKLENITKINQLVEVFQKNVTTDLSLQNIFWFAKAAIQGGLKVENVNFVTMPGNYNAYAYSRSVSKMLGKYSVQSYVTPYPNELLELVNNELSPYVEVFTKSDLDIMTVNSNGSVSSSTGHVEDSQATNTTAYWKSLWEPKEEEKPEEPVTDENGNLLDPETGEIIGNVNGGTSDGSGTGTVTDPGTGGTTPGSGESTGPETGNWPLDPVTGEPLPPEMVYPEDGTTADLGTGDGTDAVPGADGETAAGPGTDGTTADPGTSDGGFSIIGPPPAA